MTGQASVQENDAKAWAADISYPEAKSVQAWRPMAKTFPAMAQFEMDRGLSALELILESPVPTKHLVAASTALRRQPCPSKLCPQPCVVGRHLTT